MEFDLTRLNSNIDEFIDINVLYSFSKEEISGTDLISLDNVLIKGSISKDSINNFIIDVNVSGIMVLPCSITLKPVDYPFNIDINGNIEEILKEMDENSKNIVNSIDILPIIWENILMEIPSKVTSSDISSVKLEGNGWKVITESEETENPELAKLKDLL